MKKINIECVHVNLSKYKDRSIYIYELPDKQTIYLCPDCNMILAGKIMEQLATEVFLDVPKWSEENNKLNDKEESKKCLKKKIQKKKKKK